MFASQYWFSTLKEVPSDADLISQQLMLRAGLIRKLASGLYTWLPLGLRVLKKVEAVVREEMNQCGALEILMPSVHPADLWEESGRWQHYGPELLRFTDRHQRAFCYGPTHEEVVTDLARHEFSSYKQLPLTVYQIQTKFRDEIRPRFGVMRAREFIMKDAYSFATNEQDLDQAYHAMFDAYTRIFTRLGLNFRAVLADTGSIGGSYSHEFQVIADAGEDLIVYSDASDYAANIEKAAADIPGVAEGDPSPDGQGRLRFARGIEVGHVFKLGTKYSESMNARILNAEGELIPIIMGCYGIGISRIVAAAIEQQHDDRGILWSSALAPFQVVIIPLSRKSSQVTAVAKRIYHALQEIGIEVLFDDRDERAGVIFADMDLIGIPHRLVVSERGLAQQEIEYKERSSGDVIMIPVDDVVSFIHKSIQKKSGT